jgi:prevent-host-death family protein
MARYSIHEAKAQFSRLIQAALNGEEVIIARRDRPLVRLTAIPSPRRDALFGDLKGKLRMSADFNEPLEDFEDYR